MGRSLGLPPLLTREASWFLPCTQRTRCNQLLLGGWGVLPSRLQAQQLEEQSDKLWSSGNKVQDQQVGQERWEGRAGSGGVTSKLVYTTKGKALVD